MFQLPSIAVVIATRDRASLLAQCLASIAAQSEAPAQVIVVDDGGSADLDPVLRSFAGALPLRHLRQPHGGVGRARNLATRAVAADWICVMDDDDLMLPDRLRDHRLSVEGGAVDVSHGGWINFSASEREAGFFAGKPASEALIVGAGLGLTHGAIMLRTALARGNPYREDAPGGVDFDLTVRLAAGGARFGHCGSYVLLRRLHAQRLGTDEATRAAQYAVRREVLARWSGGDEAKVKAALAATQGIAMLPLAPPPMDWFAREVGPGRRWLQLVVNRRLDRSGALLRDLAALAPDLILTDPRASGAQVTLHCPLDPRIEDRALAFAAESGTPYAVTLDSPRQGPLALVAPTRLAGVNLAVPVTRVSDALTLWEEIDRTHWLWSLGLPGAPADHDMTTEAEALPHFAALRDALNAGGHELAVTARPG